MIGAVLSVALRVLIGGHITGSLNNTHENTHLYLVWPWEHERMESEHFYCLVPPFSLLIYLHKQSLRECDLCMGGCDSEQMKWEHWQKVSCLGPLSAEAAETGESFMWNWDMLRISSGPSDC